MWKFGTYILLAGALIEHLPWRKCYSKNLDRTELFFGLMYQYLNAGVNPSRKYSIKEPATKWINSFYISWQRSTISEVNGWAHHSQSKASCILFFSWQGNFEMKHVFCMTLLYYLTRFTIIALSIRGAKFAKHIRQNSHFVRSLRQ